MAVIISPTTAVVSDEIQAELLSSTLDMTACIPIPVDGPLDAGFWDDTSTGTGAVQQSDGYLMDTGATGGSTVGVRTVAAAETDIDVQARYTVLRSDPPQGATVTLAVLGLETAGGDRFELLTESNGVTSVRATVNGVSVLDDLVATSPGGGRAVLRLLKVGARVIGFIGSSQVVDVTWLADAVQPTLGAANAVGGGVVRVTWQEYTRTAVVLFDTEPSTQQITQGGISALVDVPTASQAGPVDVIVVGCAGVTDTLVDGFEYVQSVDVIKLINIPSVATLTVAGDPVIRR